MRTYYINVPTVDGLGQDTAVLVIGSQEPNLDEKLECLEVVTRLVDDGWTIAAHGLSVIGQLASRATTRCGGRFVDLDTDRAILEGANVSVIRMAPQMSRTFELGVVR
jgi:hypothetical protein